VEGRVRSLLGIDGKRTVTSFHRELGQLMWDKCGMGRTADGLKEALGRIPELREEFWQNLTVPGSGDSLNASLEYAGRVGDYFELAELMCRDALERNESCGGHFREEYQTEEGEARRDDENYSHVAAWMHQESGTPKLVKEPLTFDYVKPSQRSYK
jgi:succinate dehydrogenase / fumarate reductase flavoprotein subunit